MGKSRKRDRKVGADRHGPETPAPAKIKRKEYEQDIAALQVELVRLQTWVRHKGLRIMVVFEGRDAAGKGGVIKRITERVSPRVFRVVALPAPSKRENTQLYIQRYITHFPAAGEVVLFDRSWYNRAGVEPVMGFCTGEEYERFLEFCPRFEHMVVQSGITLIKYFFDVSRNEQERRFLKRINDPLRQWKLSPMDLESYRRWWDYTEAYDRMLAATDTDFAPWHIVKADNKRRARLNCIAHFLSVVSYGRVPFDKPRLPKRKKRPAQVPETPRFRNWVPEVY
ncbi:MAG: polyphosphate kinase 2 [Planctomycetota bacterium]|jgi:polyphosphate kinase 2